MTISDLFHSDPTRELEEVQKVTGRERIETDVREFHETDSTKRVLAELGDVIETHPNNDPRFLYVEATFGSGKTHLLKLTGLVVDDESEFADLGDQLANQWRGFDNLQQSIERSHVDRLKPVFLNLLDRDASKEPPLPFLIFEGIGRELGYPTDPNWLLEWAWRLDMEYDGVWDALQEYSHECKQFEEVLEGKAYLRSWLYEALPSMPETSGTDLDTEQGVKASIEAAEDEVEPKSFDPAELVQRVETVTKALNTGSKRTELMLGLDEVALFVGGSTHRYREFEATMEALQHGPNPVVIPTGQYSLPDTRASLIGEPSEKHWTKQSVKLEGADTEIIVRKRWLSKNEDGKARVSASLKSMPDLSLDTYAPIGSADPDPVESSPFREYDLALLRTVMQELITHGRETDRDYIQGRALLVLVRSLFTKFGWANAGEGSLVTWDVLFDLLVEETPYVPLWVQEMLSNTLIPTFGGGEDAIEVRVAKALYLLNQTPTVPSTPENLARLMVDDVETTVEAVLEETTDALDELVDNRLALTETTDEGDEVYTLVSEEQESILSRAQTKAEQVSPHQLSAWLETRLRENDDLFRSDGSRHEVDVGDERLVPLRYEYSILDSVDRALSRAYDALRVRVLADQPDTVADQVDTWQEVNDGRDGGEHVLITVEIEESMLDRTRNVIGMGQVLDEETETHEELEREHRTNKRRLETSVTDVLDDATVYTVHDHEGARSSVLADVIERQVRAVFGTTRKTLSRPLVEVDDAKATATFFRGSGAWPLTDADAAMLGVDTTNAEIKGSGWAREFINEYESHKNVDVETVLQQTRTANGDYRGTPQESIAALLITLATSNEKIALKQDTEYVTEPAAIGRQVRTKGGLTSLQIRFGVDVIDPKKVRNLAETVIGADPTGDGPDEWVGELGDWISDNSVLVKRTLKGIDREFDVSLDTFEAVIDPALAGEELSTSDLGSERELETAIEEAETFADARELFTSGDGEAALWQRFTAALDTMTSRYPDASVTDSMRATFESTTVPSVATLRSRLADVESHRVDQLDSQYQRITGETASASTPDDICVELVDWLSENEASVRGILDDARAEFDEVALDELEAVFASAWDEEEIEEGDVVEQTKTYEQCRKLFDSTEGASLWSQLEAAGDRLDADHPRSPTTTAVENTLESSRPPSVQRVEQLVKEAKDPKPPDAEDDAWAELQRVAEALRQELPNAEITAEVTSVVDDDRPTEDRTNSLLDMATTRLERIRTVRSELNALDEDSIVLVDRSE